MNSSQNGEHGQIVLNNQQREEDDIRDDRMIRGSGEQIKKKNDDNAKKNKKQQQQQEANAKKQQQQQEANAKKLAQEQKEQLEKQQKELLKQQENLETVKDYHDEIEELKSLMKRGIDQTLVNPYVQLDIANNVKQNYNNNVQVLQDIKEALKLGLSLSTEKKLAIINTYTNSLHLDDENAKRDAINELERLGATEEWTQDDYKQAETFRRAFAQTDKKLYEKYFQNAEVRYNYINNLFSSSQNYSSTKTEADIAAANVLISERKKQYKDVDLKLNNIDSIIQKFYDDSIKAKDNGQTFKDKMFKMYKLDKEYGEILFNELKEMFEDKTTTPEKLEKLQSYYKSLVTRVVMWIKAIFIESHNKVYKASKFYNEVVINGMKHLSEAAELNATKEALANRASELRSEVNELEKEVAGLKKMKDFQKEQDDKQMQLPKIKLQDKNAQQADKDALKHAKQIANGVSEQINKNLSDTNDKLRKAQEELDNCNAKIIQVTNKYDNCIKKYNAFQTEMIKKVENIKAVNQQYDNVKKFAEQQMQQQNGNTPLFLGGEDNQQILQNQIFQNSNGMRDMNINQPKQISYEDMARMQNQQFQNGNQFSTVSVKPFFQQQNQLDKIDSQRNSLVQNEDEGMEGSQQQRNSYRDSLKFKRENEVQGSGGIGHSSSK